MTLKWLRLYIVSKCRLLSSDACQGRYIPPRYQWREGGSGPSTRKPSREVPLMRPKGSTSKPIDVSSVCSRRPLALSLPDNGLTSQDLPGRTRARMPCRVHGKRIGKAGRPSGLGRSRHLCAYFWQNIARRSAALPALRERCRRSTCRARRSIMCRRRQINLEEIRDTSSDNGCELPRAWGAFLWS
jgi:hypothetical protein